MTRCNKLVQSKFFSLELTLFGAKGGRVTMGLWRAQVKPPTVKSSRPEGLGFFDIVGSNLSCTNQVGGTTCIVTMPHCLGLPVGDFWKGPPRPKLTLPPLAPKIESSKEKNLFRTSLFAAGQKVSPLAGSRCCCQDCLSATDSFLDSPAQSR